VVRALAKNRTEETRGERWARRVETSMGVVAVAVFLVFVAGATGLLWWAWRSGSWDEFYSLLLPAIPGFMLLWRVREVKPHRRRDAMMRTGARALREVAAHGDEQDAPLAEPQPAPLEDAELATDAMRIELGENHPILMGIVWVLMALLGVMGVGMIGLGAWMAKLIANPPNHQSLARWEVAVAVGMVGICIAVGIVLAGLPIWAVRQDIRRRHQHRYVADAWGMRRGEGRTLEAIAWHEVRSFFRITEVAEALTNPKAEAWLRQLDEHAEEGMRRFASEARAQNLTMHYVLDAGEHVWTWSVTRREQARQAAMYDRLWGVIVSRGHRPLRDVSQPAARIARAATEGEQAAAAVAGPSATDVALASIAPAPPSGRTQAARGKRWGRVITLAPIIAGVVFCGGGWSLQQYQRALYGGLPARIHAETPLFADSLAADDGLWPVHAATADDAAYAYVNGVYQISGNGGQAMLDRTYGDAAVGVTVQQRASNMNEKMGDLGQIGLIMRASDNPSGLVTFTIGPLGGWALMRYREWGPDAGQWQVLAIGEHNGAIHQGFVRNRLLVLMRGSEYVCFVNDQLVAVAHDDALSAGQVGLWLDDSTTIGRYASFAVYPAV
jgi:hypothetical protein